MGTDLNVLIIDDSDEDAILIMRELTRVYNAIHERVKDPEGMQAALERGKWDIVICDYIIPGFSAFAALEIVKQRELDIPFIVVSGKVDEGIVVEVMKAGAHDYILKDKLARLLPVVKRELAESEMRKKGKKMVRELEISDERYRDICENANDMIYVAGPDGRILYANPSFQKTTGYSCEELQKMKLHNLIHPDYAGYFNSKIERVASREKSEEIELCLLTKKKETIYIEGDFGVKYDKNGKIQLRGLLRDVTRKRRFEQMCEKYQVIVNASSEFMSVVNRGYEYEAVNDAYCTAQGIKREEILGKKVADVWGEKVFKEIVKEKIDRCLEGHRIKYKSWIEFPALGKRYHEVSLYPYTEKGKVVNAVIITQDITALDRTEEKKKQYVDNLAFLSKAAMGFIELGPENDIHRYIASCLKELLPDSIIVTSAYVESDSSMKVTSIMGMGENMKKILDIIGTDYSSANYEIDEESKRAGASGKLRKLEGGLHELCFKKIPKTSCKMIERLLNIKSVYSMGFAKKGELFGIAGIVLKHELSPDKIALIEAFVSQASVALLRRNAEDRLKGSEERMRILFDFAPDAYALCDTSENLVDCNRAFRKLTGYKKEEVINKKALEMITARNGQSSSRNENILAADEGLSPEEHVIKRKDGKEIIGEVTKFPIKVNEKPHHLIIIRDITERKRFVEEIRRLAKFVYENPSPMMRVSKEGKLIYANPSGIQILDEMKFEIDKTVPKNWIEVVSAVLNEGRKRNTQVKLKDRIFSFEVVPLKESGYVNLYGMDITESEESQRALKESEEKYRALFEESKDVVFISTPEGRFEDINRAGIELLGYESKEALLNIDLSKDVYMNKEDRKRMLKQLQEMNYVKDFEAAIKRKDGKPLTVLITATSVRDSKGNIKKIRNIMKDITERRNMETQLVQLQKMESLGMLAGGIAHDFNNLLTGIIGNVSCIKTGMGEQSGFMDDIVGIEESAKNAAALTNQLLAFARGGKYDAKTISLNDVVIATVRIISRTFDKKIVVETQLNEGICLVEADKVQLGQVVMNLCANARDAMFKGGKIRIETDNISIGEGEADEFIEAKPGKYVYMSVTDNGAGMDKDTARRIFEPFFTTKGVGAGTGLGLSVVYGIVKNHGGFVKVLSEPGKGSKFIVYLPASEKTEQAAVVKDPERVKGKGELVLMVDDEKEIRLLVKRILENNGYRALIAENGDEALKAFDAASEDISLVIMDMMMPKTDSSELFSKMKAKRNDIKVLISTGYSESEKTSKMLQDGVMGIIQKPFNMEILLSYIRDALDSKPVT